jgi:hypothetical protein
MQSQYLYVVGKADSRSTVVDTIRSKGFRAGILVDEHANTSGLDSFDRVIEVDFSQIDSEIQRLDNIGLSPSGFLCTYENYIVAKAKLCLHFKTPGISVESAKLTTDKALMREAFLAAEPSISPDYAKVDTLEEALDFAKNHSFPLIIKPTNLVKSLLVLRCDNEKELTERFSYAINNVKSLYDKYNVYDQHPQLIIEEFISGQQYSIAAYIDQHGTPYFYEGIADLKTAKEIGKDDTYLFSRTLPAALSADKRAEMFNVSEKGVRALKLRSTPAHIELISGAAGTKIVEIGARTGGYRPRMYRMSYGADLAEQEVRIALGEEPSTNSSFESFCAVYELFPDAEGTFTAIEHGLDISSLAYFRVTVKPGDRVGPAKNGFKAAAIVIAKDADEEKFKKICRQIEQARVEVSV